MGLGATQLDRRPVSLQVRDLMRNTILSGQFRPGDRLPTEAAFATEYGVSRSSVREAMKLLEQEGHVVVHPGHGRLVSPGIKLESSASITLLRSMTDCLTSLGYVVSSRILSVGVRAPTDEETQALDLSRHDKVVYVERFRLGNGEPLVYTQSTFGERMLPTRVEETDWGGSFMALFESWGVQFVSAVADIQAVNLPKAVARQEGIPVGTPWMLITETSYDEKVRPILFSREYMRGDVRSYHVLQRSER